MSFSFLGGFLNIFIIYAIIRAIYKNAIKGKSETLDNSISKFVDQVKSELNGTPKNKKTTMEDYTFDQTKEIGDMNFSSNIQGSYSNADDLLKSGLITKEEYRKIKRKK